MCQFVKISFIALFGAFCLPSSNGRSDIAQSTGKEAVMNGIQFTDYPDFANKWHLVTVRYRTDTSEQRFTFANELAFSTLIAGRTDFPNGAVLGKVGIASKEDPAFASSKVPAGTMRYQFMVRDDQKYSSTGGWGYALFDNQGFRYNTPAKAETAACFACHQLVSAKGYVFSEPMIGFGNSAFKLGKPTPLAPMTFVVGPVARLPEVVRAAVPKKFKQVNLYSGPLTAHLFQGSLNEIRPALTKQVKKNGLPAALISTDGERSVVVSLADPQVVSGQPPCTDGLKRYLVIERDPVTEGPFLQLHAFCDSEK